MLAPDDLLSAALAYAQLGYAVFPCVPGTKTPLTRNGFKDATTDAAQIEAWWTEHPRANIAIPTEGLIVVDVDGPWLHGDDRLADLSRCPISQTPRGGYHHFFRQPAGRQYRNTTSKLALQVDTRANGGYVLVAPSVVDGKLYRWQPTFELSDPPDRLPEPPAWLVEMLDQIHESKETVPLGDGNPIPIRQRNSTLARLAGTMRRVGMTHTEILAAVSQANTDRCQPPLQQSEVEKIAKSIARYQPHEISVALIEDHFGQDFEKRDTIFTAASVLCDEYRRMCSPVIHGLLREGETMNVIAAPKTGKSWLVLNLALSITTGQPWLGFPTVPGRVLLLDNELHPETLANRIPNVAEKMQLPRESWRDLFFVRTLRGELEDLFRMESYFHSLPAGYFKLIILDAFYRFMPRDMDENDNGTMASLYNLIDRCARRLQTGFVLVHHTTKGVQSGKSVTDVGAGAGAQSRAADCHFILRPHAQDDCLCVEAVTRSWPSPMPFVIRQVFPLWRPDPTLDPADLRRPEQYARSKAKATDAEGEATPDYQDAEEWTPESFVQAFACEQPKTKVKLTVEANARGIKDHKAEKLIEKAEALGLIHRWVLAGNRIGYATIPQPALPLDAEDTQPAQAGKRKAIESLLRQSPELSNREIARLCNAAHSRVNTIRKELEL